MSLDNFITNVSSIRVPSLVATNPLAKEMVDSKLILRAATTTFETNVVWRVKPAEDMRTEPAMDDDRTTGSSASLCVSSASARPPALLRLQRPRLLERGQQALCHGQGERAQQSATSPARAKPAAAAATAGT
jgi:hypothetical protein